MRSRSCTRRVRAVKELTARSFVAESGTVADAGGLRVNVIAGVPFVADFPERVWATAGLLQEPRRAYTATQAPDRLRHAVNRSYPVNARANLR
jgi:hypothetical protein